MTTMKLTRAQIRKFQRHIFSWWEKYRRDLPWRRTRDPYHILVSEVMLQQTQVSRVLPKFEEFLYFFPDVYALAAASPAQILRAWKGMGYNRRALYLKKTAQVIVSKHFGDFPDSEAELIKLPGLGTYTARALLVFAFAKDVAMVDTNIRQIITHFFFKGLPQREKTIQEVADALLPKGQSWEWHQALMDYGALAMAKEKRAMQIVKKQKPFKDSVRFYRGKIIDTLREGSKPRGALIKEFARKYGKSAVFIDTLIDKLHDEGMLIRTRSGILQLPDK